MRQVGQSNETNPAIVQQERFVVGLPGVGTNLLFDGPTYNQIVTKKDGKPIIDIDQILDNLEPENFIRNDLRLSSLSLAVRLKNLSLSAGHSVRYHAFFKYPETLPQVVWQGNAQFIGETVALGNELQLTGYQELAIGAAYTFGKITLGAKGKILGGIADASTDYDHHSATLYTDPDVYQITLAGDYILHTSNSIDFNDYQDINAEFDYGKLNFKQLFGENNGMTFDFGARFQTEQWDIAASVLDLGSIEWRNDVTHYAATKSYEYDGLDFSEALTGGENADLNSALDTLEQIFQVEKTSGNYSFDLPSKMYLSALFKLNERWSFGGMFFQENFRKELSTGGAVGANAALKKWLTAGATYGYRGDRFDNLGLNLILKLGPVQVFAVTDNVASLFSLGDSRNFSGRIGGNLVFK